MMPLSTMWRVDRTVDQNGNGPVAEEILDRWDHDPESSQFFRSSANFLYRFRREEQPYFLRFADSAEHSRDVIEAEMDVLCRLSENGIAVTVPVPSRQGHLVETVTTDRGVFHAVVFPALRGDQWEIDDLDESGFHRWGAALGKLHAALERQGEEVEPARWTWEDQLDAASAYLETGPASIRKEGEAIRSVLKTLPVGRDTFGLIHADFELDNLVWSDGSVGILDFDDCVHSWYVADIALALRDLFGDSVDLAHPSFQAFIEGYSDHHPVNTEMLRHIPTFLRFAGFLTYARLLRAVDLPPDGEYPEWLTDLQRKLESWMIAYEATLAG